MSRTPRLWYGNFDCEHQLAHAARRNTASYRSTKTLHRINCELACSWVLLAQPGDRIWLPGDVHPSYVDQLAEAGLSRPTFVDSLPHDATTELTPWGWTPTVVAECQARGLPTAEAVAEVALHVNARQFSAGLEAEWDVALQFASAAHSMQEVRAGLESLPNNWVIKANFSMSARERILGCGPARNDQLRWISRHLECDGVVFVEPWVEKVEEVSFQFEINAGGDIEFLGAVPLITNNQGAHRGNRLPCPDVPDDWVACWPTVQQVVDKVAAAGYRGPLGIDSMRYRELAGPARFRAIQDINARYTMGRLVLGLRRLVSTGACAAWCHVRCPLHSNSVELCRTLQSRAGTDVRVLNLTPVSIDGQAVRLVTLVLISSDRGALAAAERQLAALEEPRALETNQPFRRA